MQFQFTPEQREFQRTLTQFYERDVPADIYAELRAQGDPHDAFSPQLFKMYGERGWLGLPWPKEYGGSALSHVDMGIFSEAMGYYRMPTGAYGVTINVVGNSLITFGTEDQKKQYLGEIARGDAIWCQGFSEPNAGSDLASLQTRAVKDGDDYIINGQKVFTSRAHKAKHVYLIARTDPAAPKHKGLSIFVVPMDAPGVDVQPMWTLGGGRTNATYYDNVRVPKANLIGEENRGWYHVTTSLDYERAGMTIIGSLRRNLDEVTADARRLAPRDTPKGRYLWQRLADLATRVEIARWLGYRVAWQQSQGMVPNKEASMSRLWATELTQALALFGIQLAGLNGIVEDGEYGIDNGRPARVYRASRRVTVAGGSAEIQRNIIATRGLGLPR